MRSYLFKIIYGMVFICTFLCMDGISAMAQDQQLEKYEHFGNYEIYGLEWPVSFGTNDENNVLDKDSSLGTRDQNEKDMEDLYPGSSKNAAKELQRRLAEKHKILKDAYKRKLKRLKEDYKKEKERISQEEREAYVKERDQLNEDCRQRRKGVKTSKENWDLRRDCHQKAVKIKKEHHEKLNERLQILHEQYLIYGAQLMREYQEYYKKVRKETLRRHREKYNSREHDI